MIEKREFNPRKWTGESLTLRLLACWELDRDCSECELVCPFSGKQKTKNKERFEANAEKGL